MIASWMGYALVVGLLVSLAALAAERALLLGRKPVRRIWAWALVLSLVVPALSPRLPWHLPVPALPMLAATTELPVPAEVRIRDGAEVPAVNLVEPGWGLNKVLLTLWGAGSGLLALFLVYAVGVLPRMVIGRPYLRLSPDTTGASIRQRVMPPTGPR